MLYYSQATGAFTLGGRVVARGYAGNGGDKNKPGSQDRKGKGPLPRGLYRLTGVKNSPNTGPFTIVLEPDKGNTMFGRGDFRIHGDSISHPGNASDGCIILPRNIRDAIWNSGERQLTVTE